MKILKISISAVIIVMLAVTTIHAGGFQVNEHSPRATGMGGAVFANLHDASAIYFNPGALSFVPGTSIVFGSTLIFPSSTFTGPAPSPTETDSESQMFYPSTLFASHLLDNGLAFGLGVYNPYGLGTEWPANWEGRYLGIESTLRTFFFTPTIAYQIAENFGIGVGLNYVYGTVNLTQAFPIIVNGNIVGDGFVEFDGTGDGIGWNVGLLYKPTDELSLGIAYRSSIDLDLDGDAEFSGAPVPGSEVTTGATLPANLHVGVTYNVSDELSLNVGYQHVFWNEMERITIEYADGRDPSVLPFNYDDGFIIRFGVEYKMSDDLMLRAGYLFDSNPTPDEYLSPRLPDSDRHGFSVGLGYRISDMITVDFSYMFLQFAERTIDNSNLGVLGGMAQPPLNPGFNGTYNSFANLIGLNLRFGF